MTDANQFMCEICQINLQNKTNFDTHILGKKHQLKAHQRQVFERKEKCSVFMSGFPNLVTKDVLNEYFRTLGPVLECYIGEGNKYAIIQFKTPEARDNVLNKPHTFMGRRVYAKPRIIREQPEHNYTNEESETPQEQLLECVKNKQTFYEQMTALLHCIQPTNMYGKYLHLCIDLQTTLSQVFPHCKAHPFGSTVTGLDFKGSDVDCFIEVPNAFTNGQASAHMRAQNLVKLSKNVLIKSPLFTRIIAIPKAKTPIVKCVHNPTKICCDFNFKNMLGVFNTKMISIYLEKGKSLKPAVIFLKCWGKTHGFVGNSGKLSSYAIALMFIYYLQQWPYYMPPTFFLQMNPNYTNIQDGWNGGFCNTIPPSPIVQNASVEELLKGFFEFYAKFEYSIYMISPYYGNNIKKTDFLTPQLLPKQFERYLMNLNSHEPMQVETPICVEDPFELNYNVTRSVTQKFLSEFVAYCNRACNLIKEQKGNINLYQLLSEDIDNTVLYFSSNKSACTFKLPAGSSLAYLETNLTDEDKNKDVKIRWFESVSKFLRTILSEVFKFNLVELNTIQEDSNPGTPIKVMKLSLQNDVAEAKKTTDIKLKCSANLNLWEARRSISRDLHELENIKGVLGKEKFISNYMANDILNGKVSKDYFMEFEVTLKAITEPILMEITIEKLSDVKNQYENFCKYLIAKLTGWFTTYEKELNAAVKEVITT